MRFVIELEPRQGWAGLLTSRGELRKPVTMFMQDAFFETVAFRIEPHTLVWGRFRAQTEDGEPEAVERLIPPEHYERSGRYEMYPGETKDLRGRPMKWTRQDRSWWDRLVKRA